MASVRMGDLAHIRELGQELYRIGKELQGYGMFNYGNTITARAKDIVMTVAKYELKVVE